jgi:hypothetical protein
MSGFQRLAFKSLVGLCTVLMWNTALAQQLPLKYATLELFTNTPCPICASQNPGLFSRLEDYEGLYHLISFYPGKPYTSCIFYQANTSENTARLNFYSQVFGTPTVAINGLDFTNSNGVTNTVLNNVTNGESWLEINVDETIASTRTVNIALEDHVGGSLASGKVFAVIVEREIMYTAPNGETLHHNVFRRFLSNVNGDDVDLSSGSAALSYEYTPDPSWQADEIFAIAWLMDPETQEIYNSGTRFDPDFPSSTDNDPTVAKLNIYPIPATSEIQITLPENVRNTPVRIYNASGQLVHEVFSADDSTMRIYTTGWPVGNYHAEIVIANRLARGIFQVVK